MQKAQYVMIDRKPGRQRHAHWLVVFRLTGMMV